MSTTQYTPGQWEPVTLAEAKTRWAKHTRHVISNDARQAAKQGKQWRDGSIPTVFLGPKEQPRYAFGFTRNEAGHVFAYDLT